MRTNGLTASSPTSTPNPWAALPVLLTGAFMVVLDFFIVNVALPSVATDLRAGDSALEWIVAGYGLTFAAFLITAGRLGDDLGRRRARRERHRRWRWCFLINVPIGLVALVLTPRLVPESRSERAIRLRPPGRGGGRGRPDRDPPAADRRARARLAGVDVDLARARSGDPGGLRRPPACAEPTR